MSRVDYKFGEIGVRVAIVTEASLRERKKRRARAEIADAAARLFGERGYENVSVADVAAAAEVSPQTVYNHFGTKRDLLFDRDEEVTSTLVRLVTARPRGVSPVAAVRPAFLAEVDILRGRSPGESAGDLPALCATSSEVRRYVLESRDRQADALTAAIVDTGDEDELFTAKACAAALLSVLQSFVDHVGRRIVDGARPGDVADEVEPMVAAALDGLERRCSPRRRRTRAD